MTGNVHLNPSFLVITLLSKKCMKKIQHHRYRFLMNFAYLTFWSYFLPIMSTIAIISKNTCYVGETKLKNNPKFCEVSSWVYQGLHIIQCFSSQAGFPGDDPMPILQALLLQAGWRRLSNTVCFLTAPLGCPGGADHSWNWYWAEGKPLKKILHK